MLLLAILVPYVGYLINGSMPFIENPRGRGRKGERRSLSEDDYTTLVTAAHQQLHAPIVLVWHNVNTHVRAAMRTFIHAHGSG